MYWYIVIFIFDGFYVFDVIWVFFGIVWIVEFYGIKSEVGISVINFVF